MKHWIFDLDTTILPGWQEAMPQAAIERRDQLKNVPAGEPGLLWLRLRAGEVPAEIMLPVTLGPGQHLILLCDDPSEAVVLQALAAGASGCCNTHASPEVLRQVAVVVANGGLWIGQSLLQQLVGSTSRILGKRSDVGQPREWAAPLSERETQVALLVAGGGSNKEIASQLAISERTVKAHLTSIFEKLGLRDRLQLSLKINGLNL